LEDAAPVDLAIRLGHELLGAADESERGCSWRSSAFPHRKNLTGLSHGTAGVGYALIELFRVTCNQRYLDIARRAFSYEKSWFDKRARNWPDFRQNQPRGQKSRHVYPFSSTWCHGAPGIALSRLRAYEVLHDAQYRAEAATALQTTRKATELWLDGGGGDFSACHGLTGNAEVLLCGHQVLGSEVADDALSIRIATTGIERYAASDHQWPCGTRYGDAPGLMLGFAGIGYYYLRLSRKRVPSILLLRPQDWSGKADVSRANGDAWQR
jgi:lantibiotic modifying enzyme